jgi:hypothetical protein
MWAAGIAGFLAFGYVVYTGSIYHYGHLYVLAVAAIWLASTRAGAAVDQRMVVGLLGVQALGGLAAIALDATGPFSNGERVAAFVDREELVVVDPDWSGATVAGERGGTVFMVTSNQQRSFVRWSEARECNESAEPLCLDLDEVLARAERAEADVLVLPPEVRLPPSAPWRRVEVFDGAAPAVRHGRPGGPPSLSPLPDRGRRGTRGGTQVRAPPGWWGPPRSRRWRGSG